MIAEPPVDGAVQDSARAPSDSVACKLDGIPGLVTGITAPLDAEYDPEPTVFRASTRK